MCICIRFLSEGKLFAIFSTFGTSPHIAFWEIVAQKCISLCSFACNDGWKAVEVHGAWCCSRVATFRLTKLFPCNRISSVLQRVGGKSDDDPNGMALIYKVQNESLHNGNKSVSKSGYREESQQQISQQKAAKCCYDAGEAKSIFMNEV